MNKVNFNEEKRIKKVYKYNCANGINRARSIYVEMWERGENDTEISIEGYNIITKEDGSLDFSSAGYSRSYLDPIAYCYIVDYYENGVLKQIHFPRYYKDTNERYLERLFQQFEGWSIVIANVKEPQ